MLAIEPAAPNPMKIVPRTFVEKMLIVASPPSCPDVPVVMPDVMVMAKEK